MNNWTNTVLLLFAVLIFGCTSSNDYKSDIEELELKGDVKSIKISAFDAVERFGEVEKGRQILLENFDVGNKSILRNNMVSYHFDEEKREVRHNEYFMDGNIYREYLQFYEDDKRQKSEWTTYSRDGTVTGKTINLFDYELNEIEHSRYYADGSLGSRSTTPFTGGSSETQRDSRGNEIVTKNNDDDNIEKETHINDEGEIVKTIFYEYNEDGQVIEETELNQDGKLYSTRRYSYNENGDLRENISEYHGDSDVGIVMEILINQSPFITKYEYEYDSQGNWVERNDYENDEADRIIKREIQYY